MSKTSPVRKQPAAKFTPIYAPSESTGADATVGRTVIAIRNNETGLVLLPPKAPDVPLESLPVSSAAEGSRILPITTSLEWVDAAVLNDLINSSRENPSNKESSVTLSTSVVDAVVTEVVVPDATVSVTTELSTEKAIDSEVTSSSEESTEVSSEESTEASSEDLYASKSKKSKKSKS